MALPEEFLSALESFLTEEGDAAFRAATTTSDEETGGFRIADLDSAAWAVRKMRQAHRSIDQVEAVAAKEVAKIQAWVAGETAAARATIEAMERLLQPWSAAELQGSKKKSHKVLGTTLGFRSQEPEYKRDDARLLEWLTSTFPDYTKQTTSPDWARVKDAAVPWKGRLVLISSGSFTAIPSDAQATPEGQLVSADGELVGWVVVGVQVTERPDKFYYKLSKDGDE
jgi:hypothetical protein